METPGGKLELSEVEIGSSPSGVRGAVGEGWGKLIRKKMVSGKKMVPFLCVSDTWPSFQPVVDCQAGRNYLNTVPWLPQPHCRGCQHDLPIRTSHRIACLLRNLQHLVRCLTNNKYWISIE